jgi:signal transduction histidine kinase
VEYVDHVTGIEQFARRYWLEVPLVLLVLEGMLEVIVRRGDPDAPQSSLWFALPAVAALLLPLLARRRFPFAGAAAYWLLAAAVTFVDGRLLTFTTSVFVLGMVVAFLLGNLPDVRQARVGLAVVLVGAALVVYNVPGHPASQLVFIPILFGICWLAGLVVRVQAEQAQAAEVRAHHAEQDRDTVTRIAVAEERARIARELHDIVAHAVSVMVLQVGAVRHKLPDARAEDRDALTGVEQAGRAALTEMRRLLAVMRRDGDGAELAPQPGLDGLGSLVNEVGRAGLPVELHVEGTPFPLPQGIDLSAYRIVQEGLTNALKHARASHAEVTVRYAPDEVHIEVRDDGTGVVAPDGHGHGLIGIRERVKLYGGEMATGPAGTGGFTLSTRLPVSHYGR